MCLKVNREHCICFSGTTSTPTVPTTTPGIMIYLPYILVHQHTHKYEIIHNGIFFLRGDDIV